MNSYNCTGNIGNDVKLQYTKDSKPIVTINVAVKERDKTLWLRSTAFNATAEYISKYAAKGSQIALTGKLVPNEYKDKDGVDHKSIELIITEANIISRKEDKTSDDIPLPKTQKPKVDISAVVTDDKPLLDINGDELPF